MHRLVGLLVGWLPRATEVDTIMYKELTDDWCFLDITTI